MTGWIVVKTKRAKEAFVADALTRLGFEAWCPMEARSYRTARNRRSASRTLHFSPAIPKRLFAAIPEAAHGDLHVVRYLDQIERDNAFQPLLIPSNQLWQFRAYLDKWNEAEARRVTGGNKGKPAKKIRVNIADLRNPEVMQAIVNRLNSGA